MRLTVSIDLDELGDDAAREVGRILRYWAGAAGQVDLGQPLEHPVTDSGHRPVGTVTVGPAAPPSDGDVKQHLHAYLTRLHEALLWKIDGLGERDARWPMTPTGTNLLGLLKHVASIEAGYLGEVVGRPFPEPMPWLDDDAEPNADMWATTEESIGSVRAFAERVWAHTDASVAALALDAPAHVPWWSQGDTTLGRILVHVLVEVARHTGHADIVRELADGGTGMVEGNENLPDGDAAWWAAYVERLRGVAEAAG